MVVSAWFARIRLVTKESAVMVVASKTSVRTLSNSKHRGEKYWTNLGQRQGKQAESMDVRRTFVSSIFWGSTGLTA